MPAILYILTKSKESRQLPFPRFAYNGRMARGWESKSIEDQISAADASRESKPGRALTRFEIEQQNRKTGLLLERVRLTRELEAARNERYRDLLKQSLEHVESELAKLEG
jgi:hypothetical protein